MELAALLVDDGHSDPPLDALGNGARSRLARQPIVSSGLLVLDCVVWEWAGMRGVKREGKCCPVILNKGTQVRG